MKNCIERYHDGERLLVAFNPDRKADFAKDLRRCYCGNAPNLGVVANAFGVNVARAWVSLQIAAIAEDAGVKEKPTTDQLRHAASMIVALFGDLKLTELMHFFLLFSGGRYGKNFGAVDPQHIGEALHAFYHERQERLAQYRMEEEEQRRNAERALGEEDTKSRNAALAVCNMSMQQWLTDILPLRLTNHELAEIGWLFRL